MGKLLGAHDSYELDRPDLNKCPDCGCFFDGDNCPLCGKVCPEEMRAGNRAKVKPPKKKNDPYGGRTIFVAWYHAWWVIILALFISPIIGIILLATSPHKKSSKVLVIVIGVVWLLLSSFGFALIGKLINSLDSPVDTSLTQEEYVEKCDSISVEEYYRTASVQENAFVTMTLTVTERFTDPEGTYAGQKYNTYYLCSDSEGRFKIIVRDCSQNGTQNFALGDTITVWGEGAGNVEVYNMNYNVYAAPGINAAYIVLNPD